MCQAQREPASRPPSASCRPPLGPAPARGCSARSAHPPLARPQRLSTPLTCRTQRQQVLHVRQQLGLDGDPAWKRALSPLTRQRNVSCRVQLSLLYSPDLGSQQGEELGGPRDAERPGAPTPVDADRGDGEDRRRRLSAELRDLRGHCEQLGSAKEHAALAPAAAEGARDARPLQTLRIHRPGTASFLPVSRLSPSSASFASRQQLLQRHDDVDDAEVELETMLSRGTLIGCHNQLSGLLGAHQRRRPHSAAPGGGGGQAELSARPLSVGQALELKMNFLRQTPQRRRLFAKQVRRTQVARLDQGRGDFVAANAAGRSLAAPEEVLARRWEAARQQDERREGVQERRFGQESDWVDEISSRAAATDRRIELWKLTSPRYKPVERRSPTAADSKEAEEKQRKADRLRAKAFKVVLAQVRFRHLLGQWTQRVGELRQILIRNQAARVIQRTIWKRVKRMRDQRVQLCVTHLRRRKFDFGFTAMVALRRRRKALPMIRDFINHCKLLQVRVLAATKRIHWGARCVQRFARARKVRRGIQLGVLGAAWDREEEQLRAIMRSQDVRQLRNDIAMRMRQAGHMPRVEERPAVRGERNLLARDDDSSHLQGRRRSQAMVVARHRPLDGDPSPLAALCRIGAHNLSDDALVERASELGLHLRNPVLPRNYRRYELIRVVKQKRAVYLQQMRAWEQRCREWSQMQEHHQLQVNSLPKGSEGLVPPMGPRPERPLWSLHVDGASLRATIEQGWAIAEAAGLAIGPGERQGSTFRGLGSTSGTFGPLTGSPYGSQMRQSVVSSSMTHLDADAPVHRPASPVAAPSVSIPPAAHPPRAGRPHAPRSPE
eukprot:TRINITY_DN65247_c0_g1_i1.p1 TRINITY_DN65247_c0_g1~~TRINITY_DN65247_c0_g1_i1.p1  ORF type:complete len:863 (+),score=260.77 TRINITY_DN65247_c0_g1_i1:82-2589(+)